MKRILLNKVEEIYSKNEKKRLLFLSGLLMLLLIGAGFGYFAFNITKTSVKGVSTSTVSRPTVSPSPTPSSTPIPTPTNKPISVKAQPTAQAKQSGGWYWQSELGRAQRWLGTDSQGKDIWSDTGDPPPTPTQSNPPSINTSKKFDELQFGTSTHDSTPRQQPTPSSSGASVSGTSSSGVSSSVSSMKEVKKQICSKDGSSPNVPKCL